MHLWDCTKLITERAEKKLQGNNEDSEERESEARFCVLMQPPSLPDGLRHTDSRDESLPGLFGGERVGGRRKGGAFLYAQDS